MRNGFWSVMSAIVGFSSLFGSLCLGALAGCSAPSSDDEGAPVSGVSSVSEEYSTPGIVDRLIPVRFIQLKSSANDPDHVSLSDLHSAVNATNAVYRDAGVKFYVSSLESYATPLLADMTWYDEDEDNASFSWDALRNDLREIFPHVSAGAYPPGSRLFDWEWLLVVTTEHGDPAELLAFVPAVVNYGVASGPSGANGVILALVSGASSHMAHEFGHFLGLPHAFSPWGGTNPETGAWHVMEDYWDLIYGVGTQSSPGVTNFHTKADALAFTGVKRPKAESCSMTDAPTCTILCILAASPTSNVIYLTLENAISFVFPGDNPPSAYVRGQNVMSYNGKWNCRNDRISPSQAQIVRKHLKYDQVQDEGATNVHGVPLNTRRSRLGMRRATPADEVDFDGDGKRDIAVFRPPSTVGGTGTFLVYLSSNGYSEQASRRLERSFGTLVLRV